MKKILISAAISKFDGHLYKFNFKKKISCYRCFMPDKPALERNCESEGIFSPVAGILGSLQANEVLKTIIGLKNGLDNQMMIFDSIKINLRKIKLDKRGTEPRGDNIYVSKEPCQFKIRFRASNFCNQNNIFLLASNLNYFE